MKEIKAVKLRSGAILSVVCDAVPPAHTDHSDIITAYGLTDELLEGAEFGWIENDRFVYTRAKVNGNDMLKYFETLDDARKFEISLDRRHYNTVIFYPRGEETRYRVEWWERAGLQISAKILAPTTYMNGERNGEDKE